MSAVLDYFEKNFTSDDPLHKALAGRPALEARMPQIRQEMLSACGAQEGKNGKIELTVVDKVRWDALAAELGTISGKLAALASLVKKLDLLFQEAEAAGFDIYRKTPRAVRDAEVEWRRLHRAEPADGAYNPMSRSTGIANPELVLLAEKAESLQAECLGI